MKAIRLCFSVLAPLCVACVDRSFAPLGRDLPCAPRASGERADAAVVLVRAPVENRWLTICSGVAIAPTLVATQLKCVLGRSLPATTESNAEPAPPYPDESRDDRTGSSNLSTQCNSDAGWRPTETGNFASRLGQPVSTGLISVSPTWEPGDTPGIASTDVFTMPAESVCGDDLAVLVLERRLETPPVAIRFGEPPAQGTTLILTGFCENATYELERRDRPVSVQAVTSTEPSALAPPRTILTSSTVAGYAAGGAAFAADSTALVGLVMSGTLFPECEPIDEGSTLVMALAYYRRMLLDVAAATGETLYAEYQPEIGIKLCDE